MKYKPIAVEDSRALWHRAIILGVIEKGTFLFNSLLFFSCFEKDVAADLSDVCVFVFVILAT